MQVEIDLSFTAVLNLFLEVGLGEFFKGQLSDQDWRIIERHVFEFLRKDVLRNESDDESFGKIHMKLQNLRSLLTNQS